MQEITPSQLDDLIEKVPGYSAVYRIGESSIEALYSDPRLSSLSGMADDEYRSVIKDDAEAIVYPRDRQLVDTAVSKCVSTGTEVGIYCRVLHKTAGFDWTQVHMRCCGALQGKPVLIATYTNVTLESDIYRDILDSSERMVYVIDCQTYEILYVNAVARRRVEGWEDIVYRKPCYTCIHGRDTPCTDCLISRVDGIDGRIDIKRFDEMRGTWEHVAGRRVEWCGHDAFIHFIDDITVQEREREAYQSTLKALLTANPDSLCTFHLNLTQDICYEGFGVSTRIREKIMDPTAHGVIENICALMPDDGKKGELSREFSLASLMKSFDAGHSNVSIEYRRMAENGSKTIWARTFTNMLKDPETGDVVAVIYSLDVTKEKMKARISDMLTREAFDIVFVARLATRDVELYYLKRDIGGVDAKEFGDPVALGDYDKVIKQVAENVVIPDDRDRFCEYADIWKYAAPEMELDGTVAGLDGRCQHIIRGIDLNAPDGVQYWKFQHFILDDEKTFLMVAGSDISEAYRAQLDDERRQKDALRAAMEEAQSADRAKSDFLSRMSHDMRTPLNVILGMTRMAGEQDNPEKTTDCLSKIAISSRFMLGLINDILDMVKTRGEDTPLRPEPYAPEEFRDYLRGVIQPLCDERRIHLIVTMDVLDDCIPLQDKLRTNEIVFNLLSNAIKFSQEGGEIRYKAHSHIAPDGRLAMRVEVSDDGMGMTEEFQKHLFEPFSQEGRDDTSEMRGSGLGLAITKKLVDLIGGTIAVSSKPGEGATFTVDASFDWVPLSTLAVQPAGQVDSNTDDALHGRHVLLCEDHPLNREVALALLEKKGMAVDAAADGEEGVRLFRHSPVGFYDAILMDIRMPIMNGFEATRAIRSLSRTDARTVPIIAMTADALADDVQSCLEAGMDGHVAKPIEPELLYQALADAISAR